MSPTLVTVLGTIQPQHQAWCERNFGQQPHLMPLLGVIEEFGELALALHGTQLTREQWAEEVRDALGDICIFALDYTTKRGFQVVDALADADAQPPQLLPSHGSAITVALGRIAHAELKAWQGIRGTADQHAATARLALGQLLRAAESFARDYGWSLADIVAETWATVSQRDWTANKANGVTA